MTTFTVSIIQFAPSVTPKIFLQSLKDSSISPLITARVVQWIITPSIANHLLWDFMLLLPSETSFPSSVSSLMANTFRIRIHLPDDFAVNFEKENPSLLHPESMPPIFNLDKPLIANSTQRVELTPSLLAFAHSNLCPPGVVSMLNFISFHPFASARTSYDNYINDFRTKVGSKRGGTIKMLADVADPGEWDEVILAQYPSLKHFADMMADPIYQAANLKYRLAALRDTCILMTTEVQLGWDVPGSSRWYEG